MSEWQLSTPVAFIVFNRPETTERVFAEIAKAKPPKLLVIADGPRANRAGEVEKCEATRAIIQRVDWECDVLINFSDVNLGCRKRVSTGLDWVFDQVEDAIILEDDCLPHPTFFRFCQEMLERYRSDQRIGMISGDNFQLGHQRNKNSYYFSKYVHVWGWASWRDRWTGQYDVTMAKWPQIGDEGWLLDMVGNTREMESWKNVFERTFRGEIDTWDFQWVFANWLGGRVNILPAVNLISNLGFDHNATHTTAASDLANLPVKPMIFPLLHPIGIIKDTQADNRSQEMFAAASLIKRVWRKLSGMFR